jgi:hypothetical protein
MPEMDAVTTIECVAGTLTARDCGGLASVGGSANAVLNVRRATGGYLASGIGSSRAINIVGATVSATINEFVRLNTGTINLIGCQFSTTFEDATILRILDGWSGSLLLKDCTLTALNAGATDGATIGIDVQGTTTGAIRLEGNTIIRTAQTGAGDSHSIASSSAKDITNVGTLFNTFAPDANVTVLIGNVVTDTAI